MAGFASGQDEGNIVILIIYPKKNKLILLGQQRMDTGFVRFCSFNDLDLVLVHKRAKKRTWPVFSYLNQTLDLF